MNPRKKQCGSIGNIPCYKHPSPQSSIMQCDDGLFWNPDNGFCQKRCDIKCQTQFIQELLGHSSSEKDGCFVANKDPYEGKQISREDLPLKTSSQSSLRINSATLVPIRTEEVIIDIGGEGNHNHYGRSWGDKNAININCSKTTSFIQNPTVEHIPADWRGSSCSISSDNDEETGDNAIPNHVFGFAQHLPLKEHFADKIIVENSPLIINEIERVIKPGGTISISGPKEAYQSGIEDLLSHLCMFPKPKLWSLQLSEQKDDNVKSVQADRWTQVSIDVKVPFSFNWRKPERCHLPKGFWDRKIDVDDDESK